jgi:hypothetical protein
MNGTSYETEIGHLNARIAELAPVKRHKLSRHMVDGSQPLTVPAARMVVRHLEGCPDRSDARPAGDGPWTTQTGRKLTSTDVDKLADEAEHGYDVPAERKNPPPISSFLHLAAGYYATPSASGNNDYDFWRIDRPETGKWAGRIFVKRIVGGGTGDDMQSFQLTNIQQRMACQAIVDYGPEQSRMLFAGKVGRCTDCGRMLTDQVSRDAGRGPTCRNKKS